MEKPIQKVMAEVICRLVIEALTRKSADDVVDDNGSFIFSTPKHKFKVTVEKI